MLKISHRFCLCKNEFVKMFLFNPDIIGPILWCYDLTTSKTFPPVHIKFICGKNSSKYKSPRHPFPHSIKKNPFLNFHYLT